MFALSFRFKLLLSMMLVVAGVSGATLFITQRKVQEAYNKLFMEYLETQVTYLPKDQEARLSSIMQKCEETCSLQRLRAALAAGDVDKPYLIARDELARLFADEVDQTLQQRFGAKNGPPLPSRLEEMRKKSGGSGAAAPEIQRKLAGKEPWMPRKPRPYTFIVFLDATGQAVQPATSSPAKTILQSEARQRFQQQMMKSGATLAGLQNQAIGYFDPEFESGKGRLLEVIVTPVFDPDNNGQVIGALALAFPYFDRGEQTISDVNDIDNGTWLDGHLYSTTIAKPAQEELSLLLPAEIKGFKQPRQDFKVDVDGVPHRVFYTAMNPGSPLPVAYKVGLYSWESADKAQRDLRAQIVAFSLLALAGALAVSLLLSHGLAVPINELVAGTAEVKRGNLEVRVPVRSQDELGRLAVSFNEMTEGLALKEKYQSVLNKVTDKDVAEELLKGKVALGGEMREVSVMFCDIRGFTALTQNMNPAEVVHMLNEHMTMLTRVVYEHNGVVDKFIGDSIMAYFGAPKSYGNDAYNAVRCAWHMLQERQKLNATSKYHIQIGIGIATGAVLAGNMGSVDRLNYTVLGERVNLASRLCSVAGRMEAVIGETTRLKLGESITVEEMAELKLKGFSDSVRAYKLREVHSAPEEA